ncbi:PKD/REJ-like domain-containing protein [Plasmodiophora brassicae]
MTWTIPAVPTGGTLNVTWAGTATELSTVFNVSTGGWDNPGDPGRLTYAFSYMFVGDAYSSAEYAIVATDPTSTSVRTTLPAGSPVRVLARAIVAGCGVRSAPTWTDVVVHRGTSTGAVLTGVIASATSVDAPVQVTMNRLQTATLVLNALANSTTNQSSSSTTLVVAARSALISAFVSTCSNTTSAVSADDLAALLGTLTAQPHQLSANATRQVLTFVSRLVQQSLLSTSGETSASSTSLTMQGLTALAGSVSSAITAGRLQNASSLSAAPLHHAVVDLIASAQVARVPPCQPVATIATSNFVSEAWALDGLAHANGTCNVAQRAPVVLPADFWSATNTSGNVGVQVTSWASNPQTMPLVDAASPVTTVRAYRVDQVPGVSPPEPITVRNLSSASPINVTLQQTSGAQPSRRPACVTFNTVQQNWTTSGCATVPTSSSSSGGNVSITCACTHLTDFALVTYMEQQQQQPDPGCGATSCSTAADRRALEVVLSDANDIHRAFLGLYLTTACVAIVLVVRARYHVTKVHARRSVYVLLCLSIVVCAVRAAICAVHLALDTAVITLAVLSVLPSMCEFFLLSYFILMLWSIGDRMKRMSTNAPSGVLSGFARPYAVGNVLIAVGVPFLVVGGAALRPAQTVVFGTTPLYMAMFDAASVLVAAVCLLCGCYFLYTSRSMLKTLVDAAVSIGRHQQGHAQSYRNVGRFVFTVCALFSACLCAESVLWLMSIVAPHTYMAGFSGFYSLFLACDLLCILLVASFCYRTVSTAAQASSGGAANRSTVVDGAATRKRWYLGATSQSTSQKALKSGRDPKTNGLAPSHRPKQSSASITIALGTGSSGEFAPIAVEAKHRNGSASKIGSLAPDTFTLEADVAESILESSWEHVVRRVRGPPNPPSAAAAPDGRPESDFVKHLVRAVRERVQHQQLWLANPTIGRDPQQVVRDVTAQLMLQMAPERTSLDNIHNQAQLVQRIDAIIRELVACNPAESEQCAEYRS